MRTPGGHHSPAGIEEHHQPGADLRRLGGRRLAIARGAGQRRHAGDDRLAPAAGIGRAGQHRRDGADGRRLRRPDSGGRGGVVPGQQRHVDPVSHRAGHARPGAVPAGRRGTDAGAPDPGSAGRSGAARRRCPLGIGQRLPAGGGSGLRSAGRFRHDPRQRVQPVPQRPADGGAVRPTRRLPAGRGRPGFAAVRADDLGRDVRLWRGCRWQPAGPVSDRRRPALRGPGLCHRTGRFGGQLFLGRGGDYRRPDDRGRADSRRFAGRCRLLRLPGRRWAARWTTATTASP